MSIPDPEVSKDDTKNGHLQQCERPVFGQLQAVATRGKGLPLDDAKLIRTGNTLEPGFSL
jgi:hypothetical protein